MNIVPICKEERPDVQILSSGTAAITAFVVEVFLLTRMLQLVMLSLSPWLCFVVFFLWRYVFVAHLCR